MGISQFALVFQSATAIIFGAVVVLYLLPAARLDSFRQDMFALRDELFDYAASGNIAFSDPAYRRLRQMMNGFIRYGHRLTFFRVCMTLIQIKASGQDFNFDETRKWENALLNLQKEEVKKAMTDFHERAFSLVLTRLVLGSPILMLLFLCTMATTTLHERWHGLKQRFNKAASIAVSRFVDTRMIEEEAIRAAVA